MNSKLSNQLKTHVQAYFKRLGVHAGRVPLNTTCRDIHKETINILIECVFYVIIKEMNK